MANEVRIQVAGETSKYERSMNDVKQITQKTTSYVSNAWIKAAGAVYTAMKAWDYMQASARADQERAAFASLAASYGANADYIVTKLREASGYTIDTMMLIQKAGTAMMTGIAPDKLDKLMQIARATARMTGESVASSFDKIALAVARQSKLRLDDLGIILSAGKANEEYARTMNIVGRELTDTEKQQAFLNSTIAAGEDLIRRLGDQTKTGAEHFQTMQAIIKDIGYYIGKVLNEALRWTIWGLTEIGIAFTASFAKIFHGMEQITAFFFSFPGAGWLGFDDLIVKLKDLGDKFQYSADEAREFANTLRKMEWAPSAIPAMAMPSAGEVSPPDTTAIDKVMEEYNQRRLAKIMEYDDYLLRHKQNVLDVESRLLREKFEQELAIRAEYAEVIQEQENERLAVWREHQDVSWQQHLDTLAAIKEKEAAIEERTQHYKIHAQQSAFAIGLNFLNAYAAASGKGAKVIFGITKALQFGQAVMAAFAASAQALANPPGPPTTIPISKWALKAGLINAAAIAATSFGQIAGGGVPGGSAGGVSGAAVSTTIPITTTTEQASTQPSSTLTIIFEGGVVIHDEAYVEYLAEKISEAVEDGEVRLIASKANYAENLT